VKFQQAMECGGAYVKLLSHHDSLDLVKFWFSEFTIALEFIILHCTHPKKAELMTRCLIGGGDQMR